jgi:hypothetical protein
LDGSDMGFTTCFFSKKNTIGNNIEPQLGTKMCGFWWSPPKMGRYDPRISKELQISEVLLQVSDPFVLATNAWGWKMDPSMGAGWWVFQIETSLFC